MSRLLSATSLLFPCFASLQAFGQNIIRVPTDAQTIQIAIQKAQPFDTIIVAPGMYSEAINYAGKVIAIQSENPNDRATVEATIIDAGGLGTVVTFAGTEGDLHSSLDGLTITGGTNGIDGNGTLAEIRNCIIRNNSGAGIVTVHGRITGCVIRDNLGRGLSDCDGAVSLCAIDRNGGIGVFASDGMILDCAITRNGSYGMQAGGARIEHCNISNNTSDGLRQCDGIVRQSIISGNGQNGFWDCDGLLVENSVIAGNRGDGFERCSVSVLNCTVTGNGEYGFRNHTGSIKQAIIWSNTSGALTASTTPILSGTANPFFVQPGHWNNITNVWIDGDYHLTSDSPYIDAGDPFYGDDKSNPTEDLDGNPRVVGVRIDIGAYEFQAPCEGADFDDDGTPDICDRDIDDDGVSNTLDACDFTPLGVPVDSNGRPHADLNHDCEVNLADFAVFQSSFR